MQRTRIFCVGLLAALVPLSVLAVDNEWNSTLVTQWTNISGWSQSRLPINTDKVWIFRPVAIDNVAANTAAKSFTNVGLNIYSPFGGTTTFNVNYTNTATFRVNGQMNIGKAIVNWNTPNATFHFNDVFMNSTAFGGPGELNILAGTWYSPIAGGAGFTVAASPGSRSVVNLHSNASLISLANFNNEIGSGGDGQLNIMGGTLNLGAAIVGASAGSTGRIVMTSGNIVLTNSGGVYLGIGSSPAGGVKGYGELIISNGTFFSTGSHRLAIGAGVNSVGGGGRGVMQVFGGSLTNFGQVEIGASHNSTGTLLMAGGTWEIRQDWLVGGENTNSFGGVTVSNGTLRSLDANKHILLGNGNTSYGEFNLAGGSVLLQNNSFATATRLEVGVASGSTGRLRVTGGLLEILGWNTGGLIIATNSGSTGSAVLEGGLVSLRRLDVGAGGVLSNRTGGVLQFLQFFGQETVVTGSGAKIVDGGTLSYKGYTALNATGEVSKFSIVSGSILQLDSSTNVNITGTYTLTNAANSFKTLSLTGAGPRWQSDTLQIASNARLEVSNAVNARLSSVIDNQGTIKVTASTVTYEQPVSVSGRYISDPSTSTFNSNVTVTANGTLEGGSGDVFDFQKSLIINSTNRFGFNLRTSTVIFSSGGMHTNEITGRDLGTNGAGYSDNFAYGTLRLGSAGDQICFDSGDGALSNALYVGFLDLMNTTSLVANLHAPTNINIYYLLSSQDSRNAYLMDQSYQLTDCDGVSLGGMLLPAVPEPSALAMLAMAACVLLLRRRG